MCLLGNKKTAFQFVVEKQFYGLTVSCIFNFPFWNYPGKSLSFTSAGKVITKSNDGKLVCKLIRQFFILYLIYRKVFQKVYRSVVSIDFSSTSLLSTWNIAFSSKMLCLLLMAKASAIA